LCKKERCEDYQERSIGRIGGPVGPKIFPGCGKKKTMYKQGGHAPCSCHVTQNTVTEAIVDIDHCNALQDGLIITEDNFDGEQPLKKEVRTPVGSVSKCADIDSLSNFRGLQLK
jgi:hypothetical protein